VQFTPSRLTVARKRRGMKKKDLASAARISTRILFSYEKGDAEPSDDTLRAIASALRFPVEFFGRDDIDEPAPQAVSFRSLTNMTASQRDAALAGAAFASELAAWIDDRFALPAPNVPNLREQDPDPEAAAETVRNQWGLADRPIKNMVHLLEAHGVRVFSLAEDCRELDAFSYWDGPTPFVFLNTKKSGERGRVDAAHELGHLVMHRHGGPRGREAEQQADAFASAFLMPRTSVLARAPRAATLPRLIKLKSHWKVSVAALTYRLKTLDLLTEWQHRTLWIDISTRGYRSHEPDGIERETSQVLPKIFSSLQGEGISKRDIARGLALPLADLEALVFGLAVKNGQREISDGARAHLRLV
jgi:Zn-dependent peptidase ImmA (M78 family)/DNA-binding XRE family transcriptional regulator